MIKLKISQSLGKRVYCMCVCVRAYVYHTISNVLLAVQTSTRKNGV